MITGTNKKHTGTETAAGETPKTVSDGNVCKVLCGVLLEGIDIHRVLAAQALGGIGGSEATDALIKALLDEDEDVRTDAATALAGLADPASDRQLLENLVGDPCAEVKLAAMTALAATGNEDVKPWLLRILDGRDEEIAWDEDEFIASGWDDWADMQLKAMKSLADLGAEEAIPGILVVIDDDEAPDIAETAMKALARIGPAGIEALAAYVDNDDLRRRRRAAAVLAHCDGDRAMAAVRRAIQDPSDEVRLAVARGLAEKNPADERLAVFFLDDLPRVRMEAVRLCGAHNRERLDLLLDDKDPGVRQAVLELFADHPECSEINGLEERLRQLLQSPPVAVAAAAVLALAAVSPQNAVADLVQLLAGEKVAKEVRRAAIRGLRKCGGDEALQALTAEVAGGDRQLRLDAMSAIAEMAGDGDGEWPNAAGDILLAALTGELVPAPQTEPESDNEAEPEAEAETPADSADGDDGDDDADEAEQSARFPTSTLDAIVGAGQQERNEEPSEKIEKIEMTEEDIEFLSLTGGDGKGRRTVPLVPDVAVHEDVRMFAARLVGEFARPDVAVALLDAYSSPDKELKQAAADSLARIAAGGAELPAEALAALQEGVKSQDSDIRRQAVRALGHSQGDGVVMTLINALDDKDRLVRKEAIHSLGRIGEAGAGVSRFMEDPDPTVRLAAAQALAETRGGGIVDSLVDFSCAFEGYHGRDAARLLAAIDIPAANVLYVNMLADEERKRYWKVAIEALGDLNRNRAAARTPVST